MRRSGVIALAQQLQHELPEYAAVGCVAWLQDADASTVPEDALVAFLDFCGAVLLYTEHTLAIASLFDSGEPLARHTCSRFVVC